MNEKHLGEEPTDIAMIVADDELLELLGRGGVPDDGDEVATMLAAWRADLAADPPVVRSAVPPSALADAAVRRRRASRRVLLAAAAATLALAGTATVAAGDAQPGSPLWPLTRVLYADRAGSVLAERDAQRAIGQAREAIAQARYTDAEKLLDEATTRATEVRNPDVVRRLLDEVAAVRGLLPGVLPAPSRSTTAGPGGTGAGGESAGTDTSGSGGSGGGPSTTTSPGGVLPPLPLPSVSVPGLPLPTITL